MKFDLKAGFQKLAPWFQRRAEYFRPLVDPALPLSSRAVFALKLLGWLVLTFFVLLCLYTLILIPFMPSVKDMGKGKFEKPSVLISVDGKTLATYRRFNREWMPLKKISKHVIEGLIATEDRRFYQHHGIDFYRMAGAMVQTLSGDMQGGSTLTQQLARNLFPEEIGRERSITRKIKETITALKIEHAYSKQEILETYLNTVPFLYNAVGIEMAARTYFDKPAAKLNVLESATLVGMLKGTSYYNPVSNTKRSTERRNVVLAQMVKQGALTDASFNSLKKRPIRLDFERQLEARGPAPHFAEHVRKWLIDWADQNDYNIYEDGLKVYTTIDSRLQAAANQAVQRQTRALQAVADVEWSRSSERLISTSAGVYAGVRPQVAPFRYFWESKDALVSAFIRESAAYRNAVADGEQAEEVLERLRQDDEFMEKLRQEKTRLEAGFIAFDPLSGDVKAWVGGRDFSADQFDHVARARRQPGSTFKPFVYGAALEKGMEPDARFIDQIVDIPLDNGSVWRPEDMTPPTGRTMTAREGLMYSKNTITAQVMQQVGPKKAADFARRAGIRHSTLEAVPSLALGTSPVSLLEMSTAFGTIASGGYYRVPLMVTRIEDRHGKLLVVFSNKPDRVVSRRTTEELIGMMRGVVNAGTGEAIRTRFGIRADVAGKTGTTQNNTDGWFMLMHPQLVTGAWVGFNDGRVTMRSSYWGQGAHTALPVVGDFFRQALDRRMIDARVQFPRARDALPGSTVWGPVVDWWDRLRGKPDPYAPPPDTQPVPKREPIPDEPDKPSDGTLNEIRRGVNEIEKSIEDVRDLF